MYAFMDAENSPFEVESGNRGGAINDSEDGMAVGFFIAPVWP
jgi:hypothetical protein